MLITRPCNHVIFGNRLASTRGGELFFAHLGGVPVEETLGALAPVAVAAGAALRATVRGLLSRRRARVAPPAPAAARPAPAAPPPRSRRPASRSGAPAT